MPPTSCFKHGGEVRYGEAGGQPTVLADRGFYAHNVVCVRRQLDLRVSITIRQHKGLRCLIKETGSFV